MTKIPFWWQFTKERFGPWSHMPMIIVFLLAHILIAGSIKTISANSFHYLALLIGVTAFYFKLRLYDEVKDYELDLVINKNRPLPRGLLNHQDMYLGMVVCIIIEILCFGSMGFQSLLTMTLAILYSLLMYKEFFIPKIIRPHLTTYALTHTIVTTLLSCAIFSFLTKASFWEILTDSTLLSFSLANWLLFNIFEFGRKTFATSEERENIDTYSSLFGRIGAVILVISQAAIGHFLAMTLTNANQRILYLGLSILFMGLILFSLNYIMRNTKSAASLYRIFSSVYIIIYYLIIILSYVIL